MLGLTLDILRAKVVGITGGGGTPPPYTPPMDAYPADVAYSVRLVSTSYTGPCMEVYRVSDGATQDIGFDSFGRISATELAAFSGGSVLEVQTWYDQMPGANHAVATASVSGSAVLTRAVIYDGSSIITDGLEPALDFVTPPEYPTLRFTNLGVSSGYESFQVTNADTTNSGTPLYATSTGYNFNHHQPISYPTGNVYDGFGSNVRPGFLGIGYPNMYMQHVYNTTAGPTKNVRINNTLVGTASAGANVGSLSHYISAMARTQVGDDPAGRYTGYIKELFIYKSIQTSGVRDALTSNINNFYQIGNFPDYTSGFLADYSGAAAAYSVRKLSNTAIKCMRVRRDIPPYDELDIGFTPAGDLDEQAIVDFGGSNVLVVSRWYDQSGQSNHAVQDTPGNQPQIYNGTKVLTDMGRPTLFASADAFDITTISGLTEYTISYVARGGVGKMPAGNSNSASRTYLPWYQNASTALFRHSTVDRSVALTNPISTNQRLTFMYWDSNTVSHAVDGNTPDVSSAGYTAQPTIDRILDGYGGTLYNWDNNFQEIVIWNTDKNAASQRTAIETNVNDYFYVYNTSGFVVDYPNALTAYSVRQLGNRQRYAMRVRRLGGAADYLDVGFVSGELDTQAIIDFGGSDTLGVEVWYDQTKSGNDATNTDTTTMPIIYNGSSVITDGGKPALGRNSAGLYYSIGNIVPVGVTQASFISVVQGPDAGTLTRTWHGSGGGSLNSLTTGNNLYIYNGGSPQFGSGPAVGRTLGIQLTDGNPGAAEKGWRNGVLNYSADSGPNSPRTASLGSITLAQTPLFMQEMILYPSDIDAGGTRTNIETNIMTYYGIP